MRALEVAKYILFLARNQGDSITALQLQGLLYFTQAYSLHFLEKPIFSESIEALQHGPMISSVFYNIESQDGIVSFRALKDFKTSDITEEYKTIIRLCYSDLGRYSSSYLLRLSLEQECYQRHYIHNENNIIPLEDIATSIVPLVQQQAKRDYEESERYACLFK